MSSPPHNADSVDDIFDDDEVLQGILDQIEREEGKKSAGSGALSSSTIGVARVEPEGGTTSSSQPSQQAPFELPRPIAAADEIDQEDRLQALVELTTSTPSFRKPSRTLATDAPLAPHQDATTGGGPSPSESRANNKETTSTEESTWGLEEEEKVLNSILDAIHCQQSTVSGDLAGDPRTQKVDDVLQRAEAVASAGVIAKDARHGTRTAANDGKGDQVLHFHEHVALRGQLEKMASSLGRPTCSTLVPRCATVPGDSHAAGAPGNAPERGPSPLYAAIGTSLSVVVLLSERWESLGVLGSVDTETVRTRTAVVSVALTEDAQMCTSGHANGVFILWSISQLSAVRVLSDEFMAPVLSIRALHSEQHRFIALDASGTLRLLRPTRVMGATMVRTSSVVQPNTAMTPLTDFDVIPHPSSAYLMDTNSCVSSLDRASAAALFAPLTTPAASPTRQLPLCVPDRHLIACVFSDTLLVYTLDQASSTPVVRHTHPPTSSLSNELVQFVPMEQDRPEIRLCVAWNTELELLRIRFDIAGQVPTLLPEIERLAVVRHPAPIATLCAVADGNLLYVDQDHRVTLMDATVFVEAERPTLSRHLDILAFTHRMCGARYKGAMSSNREMVLAVGRRTAFSMTLLPWYARLDALLERQQFTKALELLQSFTQEVALSTVGMSSQAATRRKALSAYMTKVCVAYVSHACAQTALSAPVKAAIEVLTRCSAMDTMPVFFGPVMTALRQARQQDVALYALESGLCGGFVTHLPEPLIDAFYAFFADSARLGAVEEHAEGHVAGGGHHSAQDGKTRAETALLHLDDGADTLLALAQQHGLIRLELCVLSLRQGDYVAALDTALQSDETHPDGVRTATVSPHTSAAVEYFCATLQGLSLVPEIELPLEHRAHAKRLLWESLFDPFPGSHGTRLVCLLKLDPDRVIHALLSSLAETGPCHAWGAAASSVGGADASTRGRVRHIWGSGAVARVSALAHVFACLVGESGFAEALLGVSGAGGDVEGETGNADDTVDEEGRHFANASFFHVYDVALRPWPEYRTVDVFLTGLATLIAEPECPLVDIPAAAAANINSHSTEGSGTPVSRQLIGPHAFVWPRLGGCLCTHFIYLFRVAEDDQERHRVQDALIRCMRAPVFACVTFSAFETDFKRNNMARATAALLCDAADFTAAIDCFLDAENGKLEPGLAKGVFVMLRAEMARLSAIKVSALSAMESSGSEKNSSVDANAREAHKRAKNRGARLRRAVMERVPVLVKVDATALAQFVFEYLPSNNAEVINVLRNSSDTFFKYLDELVGKRDPAVLSDVGLQNTYIELLSVYQPNKVLPYLERQGTAITYDVQQALRAVRRHRVADATIYLLERVNMVPDAMQVLFDTLRSNLCALRAAAIADVHESCVATTSPTSRASVVADADRDVNQVTAAVSSPAALSAKALPHTTGSRLADGSSAAAARSTSLFESRYNLPRFGKALTDVDKYFGIGESLCSTYDSGAGTAGNAWFELLDVFATPRRLLSQRLEQHRALEKTMSQQRGTPTGSPVSTAEPFAFDEMQRAFSDRARPSASLSSTAELITLPALEAPLTDAEVCYTQTMVDTLTSYSSSLLHSMIDVLDMATVVEKVVKDHEQERFAPFRPIILDVMSSIRFNVKAHHLAQTCAVDDVVRLGRELYRQLNRGAVPRTDTCCLCHELLTDVPRAAAQPAGSNSTPVQGAVASSRSVLVFSCGHAYHERCAAQWKSVTHNRRCPQCTRQRLGELVGASDETALAERGDGEATAKPEAASQPVLDSMTCQRRLRFMRARLSSHSSTYYDILKASISTTADSTGNDAGKAAVNAGLRLVLSPPAPPAASTVQLKKPAVDLTQAIAEALTDADILELFGG